MAAMSSVRSASAPMDVGAEQGLPAKPTLLVNACEACRSAKVRCQPSAHLGTCKR
jgi:hypothetical protein